MVILADPGADSAVIWDGTKIGTCRSFQSSGEQQSPQVHFFNSYSSKKHFQETWKMNVNTDICRYHKLDVRTSCWSHTVMVIWHELFFFWCSYTGSGPLLHLFRGKEFLLHKYFVKSNFAINLWVQIQYHGASAQFQARRPLKSIEPSWWVIFLLGQTSPIKYV